MNAGIVVAAPVMPGTDATPPDPLPPTNAETLAVLGRLQAACASDTPVSLLAAHRSLSWAGRLRSASVDGVVVEIPNPPIDDTTLLGTMAALSFPLAERVGGFVAEVIQVRIATDGGLLATLRLPQQLRLDDRRSAVRIAVPRDTLAVALVNGDTTTPVRAVDISLQGILLEVDRDRANALALGRTVTVSLTLGDTRRRIDCEVCRSDGHRFGLRFTPADRPPSGMAQIMYELQAARRPTR